eukprot:8610743-Alexandrium_andersonii.AAC.1
MNSRQRWRQKLEVEDTRRRRMNSWSICLGTSVARAAAWFDTVSSRKRRPDLEMQVLKEAAGDRKLSLTT